MSRSSDSVPDASPAGEATSSSDARASDPADAPPPSSPVVETGDGDRVEQIGPWHVDGVLGRGGFGVVYRGHDASGRKAAIKLGHPASGRRSTRDMVWQQNEIEALARLEHDAVVQVLGHGFLDDGRIFIAMELAEGTSLDAYLRERGRLDPLEALAIVREVSEALAHCHERDVLHLDLKPQNIIVVDPHSPSVKVLDFGLATLQSSWKAGAGEIAGTPEYMAPETLAGTAVRDPRVDIYALGVILYELLTGRVPHEGGSLFAMLNAKQQREHTPLAEAVPDLASGVATFVERLMDPNPDARIGSTARVAQKLKSLYFDTLAGDSTDDVSDETTDDHSALFRTIATLAEGHVGSRGLFVGRDAEIRALRLRWSTARQRRGQAALLIGTAGVGKSRLLAEFLDQLDGDPLIAYGRCREIGGLVPYSPLREALSELATRIGRLRRLERGEIGDLLQAHLDADDRALLVQLVPEFEDLLDSDEIPARRADGSSRIGPARIGAILRASLDATAQHTAVMLVVEDLHWADDATLEAIDAALANSLPIGAMVLGTSRPSANLPEAQRLPRVELRALERSANDTLLSRLLNGASSDVVQDLKRHVPLLATGSPLFTTQVVRDLRLAGCLDVMPDDSIAVDAEALAAYDPPETAVDVVARLVDRLSRAHADVLGVAALLGRRFNLIDLTALDLFDPDTIEAAMSEAQRHNLVARAPNGFDAAFAHDTIRGALESRLDPELLPAFHTRIAQQLQSRDAPPGALAHHLHRAGDIERAVAGYLAAGIDADALQDPAGATDQLQTALELALDLDDDALDLTRLGRVAFELVRVACQTVDDTDSLLRALERAEARYVQLAGASSPSPGSAAELARCGLDSAFARLHYTRGEFAEAFEYCQACVSVTADVPLVRRYQLAPVNIMGRGLVASGRFTRAAELLKRGCQLADEAGAMAELCHSRGMLGLVEGYLGRLEQARAHVAEGSRLADEIGDPVRIIGSLFYEAVLAECTFDYDAGSAVSARALRYAEEEEIGGLYLYLSAIFAGRHQFHTGRLQRARGLLTWALSLSDELGISMGVGWAYGFLGDVHVVERSLDMAERAYVEGFEVATQGAGDGYAASICQIGRGHVAALRGESPETVRSFVDDARRRARENGNIRVLATLLQRAAEAMDAVGVSEDVHELVTARRRVFEQIGVPPVDWWPRAPRAGESVELPRAIRDDVEDAAERDTIVSPPPSGRDFWHSRETSAVQPDASPVSEYGETVWLDEDAADSGQVDDVRDTIKDVTVFLPRDASGQPERTAPASDEADPLEETFDTFDETVDSPIVPDLPERSD